MKQNEEETKEEEKKTSKRNCRERTQDVEMTLNEADDFFLTMLTAID